MAEEVHEILDPSQLPGLRVRRLLSWRAPARIAIKVADTPAGQVAEWERRLSRLQGACGCEQGGLGLILGLGGYLLFLWLRPGGWGDPGSSELWLGIAVVSAASIAGKVVGLRLAQRELQRTAREIRAQWTARPPDGGSPRRQTSPSAVEAVHRRSQCCGRPSSKPRMRNR